MGIGFRELIVLLFLFTVPCIVIVVIWLLKRRNRGSSLRGNQRPTAERLAELESLRRAGHISTGEYEAQRASIISGV